MSQLPHLGSPNTSSGLKPHVLGLTSPPPKKKTLKTSFLGLKDFFLGLNTSYHGSKPPSWGSKPPITNQNLLFGAEHSPFGAQPFPYELCPTHFGAKHPLFWAHVLPRPSHPPLLGLKPVFWGCRTLLLGPNMPSLGPNAPPIMAQNPLFASFFPIPTQPSPLGLKTPFLGLIPPTHLPSQVSKSPFGSQTFLLGDESLLLGLIPPHQSSNPPTGAKNLTFGGRLKSFLFKVIPPASERTTPFFRAQNPLFGFNHIPSQAQSHPFGDKPLHLVPDAPPQPPHRIQKSPFCNDFNLGRSLLQPRPASAPASVSPFPIPLHFNPNPCPGGGAGMTHPGGRRRGGGTP